MEIINRKFRRMMDQEGLSDVMLFKGEGYFYICSEGKHKSKVYSLESTSVYVNSFNQMTPEEWVSTIKEMLQ